MLLRVTGCVLRGAGCVVLFIIFPYTLIPLIPFFQSAIGSRQSQVGNLQSAVSSRQSAIAND